MRNQQCIFCHIIANDAPAHVLDENEEVIVFLSRSNHPLVVTKAHIPDIYALSTDLGAAVMEKAIAVAKAMKVALQCDGVYLTQANEHAAGQDVFYAPTAETATRTATTTRSFLMTHRMGR